MKPITTIAIVSALREELDYLFDKEELCWGPLCDLDNKLQVRECSADNFRIVAANASGKMGLTESAILTTRVILGCKPDIIAMIGVCGGFKTRGVNIGDVIVAEKSFHYQFGSFEDGSIQRELKVCEIDHRYFSKILDFLNQAKMSEIQTSSPRGMKKSDKVLKVRSGPMASADLVVKDENKLNEAKIAERKVIAVDMESYAFLRASELHGVKAVVVKSVSDFADSQKGEDDDLREYAKYNATEALVQFLKNEFALKKEINNGKNKVAEKSHQQIKSSEINRSDIAEKPAFLDEIEAEMSLLPAGYFQIGDKKTGLQKMVIKKPFLMSKVPVTQNFYEEIMGVNPSHFKGNDLPVEKVTWFDAIEFCNELSRKCGLHPVYIRDGKDMIIKYENNGFRLPTEAEWEYAACKDNFINNDVSQCAWYMSNSGGSTQKAGQKNANLYGLHDMFGNVWEWCNDWYRPYDGSLIPPEGPSEGENRIRRGGSWANFANNLNPKYRERSSPNFSDNHIGFRIVKVIDN